MFMFEFKGTRRCNCGGTGRFNQRTKMLKDVVRFVIGCISYICEHHRPFLNQNEGQYYATTNN